MLLSWTVLLSSNLLLAFLIRSVIQDPSQVADKLQIHPVPSAFQIRFGGCKGMVAQDPTLGNDTDVLVIRKSMRKFESKSNNLEILDVTRPGKHTDVYIALK